MDNRICFILTFLNENSLLKVAVKCNRNQLPEDVIDNYKEPCNRKYFESILPEYFISYGFIIDVDMDLFDVVDIKN